MSEDDVRVANDPTGRGVSGASSDLLRLQTEFQARLAEETLDLPAPAPGGRGAGGARARWSCRTAAEMLTAPACPGTTVELALEIENRQRVHAVVTPMLGPLVSADGRDVVPRRRRRRRRRRSSRPSRSRALSLAVPLPPELPPGTYRGALVLQGFRDGGIPVAVEVPAPRSPRPAARKPRAASRAKTMTGAPASARRRAGRVRPHDRDAARVARRPARRPARRLRRRRGRLAGGRVRRARARSVEHDRRGRTRCGRRSRRAGPARTATRSGRRSADRRLGVVAIRRRRCSTSSATTSRSLLADDLDETLELLPIPRRAGRCAGTQDVPRRRVRRLRASGYWAFSREVVRAVEALAEPTLAPPTTLVGERPAGRARRTLLR